MANNLAGSPWILDTAGTDVLHANVAFISSVVFSGYSDATHKAILEDARGVTVTLDGVTDLSSQAIYFSDSWKARGLKLTTLDSGKVTVFLK